MIVEHLYTVEDYATFFVCVRTNNFAGACNFCIPTEIINQCVISIDNIITNLSGSVILRDFDSDAYLEIGFKDKRNFIVKGQLGGAMQNKY